MAPNIMVERLDKLMEDKLLPQSILNRMSTLADELEGIPNTVWGDPKKRNKLQAEYNALTEPFG